MAGKTTLDGPQDTVYTMPLRSPAGMAGKTPPRRRPTGAGSSRYGARPGRPGRLGPSPNRSPSRPAATEPDRDGREDPSGHAGVPEEILPLRSPAGTAGKTPAGGADGAEGQLAATEPGRDGREDALGLCQPAPGAVAATEPGRDGREDT